MNNVFNILVYEGYTTKLESLFNTFRVGLGNWDRSRIMTVNGINVVNYTVICTKEVYDNIIYYINQ